VRLQFLQSLLERSEDWRISLSPTAD
jgi:hypothetical protein